MRNPLYPLSGRPASFCFALLLAALASGWGPAATLGPSTASAAVPKVHFDAAYAVPCRDVTPPDFAQLNPHERLVEARVSISSLIKSGSEDDLAEFFYRMVSPQRTLEIVDYLPKTTLATDIAGNISIEDKRERSASLGVSVSAGFPHALNAGANTGLGTKNGKTVHYEKLPPLESLTAAGTLYRGSGVYFKLRPSTRTSLEGGNEFVLMLRVPIQWRADYLQLDCQASGWKRGPVRALDERITSGAAGFLVALYLEGDDAARDAALELTAAEGKLRRAAAEIAEPRPPASLAGRFGQMLSGGDTGLPEDWLEQLVGSRDGSENRRLLAQLPAPVRETAIRYLVARNRLESLNHTGVPRAAAAVHGARVHLE